VVGAGLAGSEVALTCARAGLDVLLVTTSLDTVYNLFGDGASLRPPAGTVLEELVGALTEAQEAQVQIDGSVYVGTWALHRRAKWALETHPKLHLLQSSVSALKLEDGRVIGVETWEGVDRFARRVVLCVGSFLGARLRVGELTEAAGRLSEMAYDELFGDLRARGVAFERSERAAPVSSGALPYTVSFHHLSAAAWDPTTFAVPALPGLYAAGVCAVSELSYEAAAAQGQALAKRLVAAYPAAPR
jgi:tRNA U34 5-carboxymethylaminomethyl modifying enzyme MnmG/GidA